MDGMDKIDARRLKAPQNGSTFRGSCRGGV